MGREIRRVPANWEHPKDEKGHYIPLLDVVYEDYAREWMDGCIAWENGTHEHILDDPSNKESTPFYWDWNGMPPDKNKCRPKFETEPTWYQSYETISEGTPVTPPFATKEELIEYLVKNGDFWDQWRGDGGWSRKNAEKFVSEGWKPTGYFKFVVKDS